MNSTARLCWNKNNFDTCSTKFSWYFFVSFFICWKFDFVIVPKTIFEFVIFVGFINLNIRILSIIMTSPCNGKALCFHAHPRIFRFEWNFLYIWTCYHEYIMNLCMSVCPSVCRLVKWTSTQKVIDFRDLYIFELSMMF